MDVLLAAAFLLAVGGLALLGGALLVALTVLLAVALLRGRRSGRSEWSQERRDSRWVLFAGVALLVVAVCSFLGVEQVQHCEIERRNGVEFGEKCRPLIATDFVVLTSVAVLLLAAQVLGVISEQVSIPFVGARHPFERADPYLDDSAEDNEELERLDPDQLLEQLDPDRLRATGERDDLTF